MQLLRIHILENIKYQNVILVHGGIIAAGDVIQLLNIKKKVTLALMNWNV